MYLKCYTLDNVDLSDGINITDYECILSDKTNGRIMFADLQMIPILPYTQATLTETAHLSLSFLKEAVSPETVVPGSIISVDPNAWRLCLSLENIVLLDPCSMTNNVLLFLPPSCPNVLISADRTMRILGTNKLGEPEIRVTNRAAAMLQAIGCDITTLFHPEQKAVPAKSPRERKADGNSAP